jgi:hypothetical protein
MEFHGKAKPVTKGVGSVETRPNGGGRGKGAGESGREQACKWEQTDLFIHFLL